MTPTLWRVGIVSGAGKPEQIPGGADRLANTHVFAGTALNFLLQNLSR